MYMGDASAIQSGPLNFPDLPALLPDIGSATISQGYNMTDSLFPDGGTFMAQPKVPPMAMAPSVPTVAGIELTPKNLLIAAIVAYLLLRK